MYVCKSSLEFQATIFQENTWCYQVIWTYPNLKLVLFPRVPYDVNILL